MMIHTGLHNRWGAECACIDPHDNAMRVMKTNKSSSTKGAQEIKSGPVSTDTLLQKTLKSYSSNRYAYHSMLVEAQRADPHIR